MNKLFFGLGISVFLIAGILPANAETVVKEFESFEACYAASKHAIPNPDINEKYWVSQYPSSIVIKSLVDKEGNPPIIQPGGKLYLRAHCRESSNGLTLGRFSIWGSDQLIEFGREPFFAPLR